MSYRLRLALIVLAALAAGCKKAQPRGAAGAGAPGGGMPPMPVEVAAALKDTVVDAVAATGQIEPVQSIDVHPEVTGRITEILVNEGQEVDKGTPLFKVDDVEIKAQVDQADAERELARQALERTKQLIAQNASSAADLEQAQARSKAADANYDLLKTRLDRTVVRAPFSGVVGRRLVSIGAYVSSATALITLQSVNPEQATFQVPERYADQLRRGQLVSFQVAALPGKNFSGEVVFVDPVVELPGRTILIKARVPNPDHQLQAGMFLEARLATNIRPDAVVVPEDALLPVQGATYVWVVKDAKADRRQVTVGVRTSGWAEIKSGVEAGEQVVVGGLERLFPGATVMAKVIERHRGAATGAESTSATSRPATPPPSR